MSYHKVLASMIKKSRLTLREISDKCKEYNVSVDQSYISKLQSESGKQSPASDEINIAIAKVCGVKPEELLFEAFMTKAPKKIRNLFKNLIDYFRDFTIFMVSVKTPEFKTLIKKQVDSLSDYEIIKDFIENFTYLKKANRELTRKLMDNKDFMRLMPGPSMIDDSMAPIIPKDALLDLDVTNKKVISGDIVLAMLKEGKYVIRRYVPIDDKIVLIAENKEFEPLTLTKESVQFLLKVNSMTVNL